ncbi:MULTISPECIES: LacI family DNA-binding transcriptional regulator [Microbacterium]|jgi:DNA-binding LacI/PurR family transcriptional regulator|uniref:LacI family DNA-binding transcriptional regulator n=1 Tax=Microbacterium TaxID=33882 RepID=UPI001E595BEC|nr:LacI family DNA-binding transcriptional regulator [Microbacterium nymphoidis]MCD2498332.1 LacI family DNA-binding transcriptional regulator [Microbacterium nymphoidis]
MTRKPTLADVARRAGVSASTASVVYSGKVAVAETTKDKVLAAAAELGYAGPDPRAASLRRGRSGIVGVVVGSDLRSAFADPILTVTMDGVAESIASSGAGILLLRDDPEWGGPTLATAPIDAVALIGCNPTLRDSLDAARSRGIPMVVIEGDAGPDVPQITIDSLEAQRQLARHVRSLGHERVALVTLPLSRRTGMSVAGAAHAVQAEVDVTRERLEGAREIFPDAVVVSTARSTIDNGYEAGRLLFGSGERPTAVLAQSDMLAAGVLRAALDAGLRVPEEVSITGFDGITVDGIAPYRLTTMAQPALDKGRAAGEALARLLADEPAASFRFTCEFIEGNTTGPAPV